MNDVERTRNPELPPIEVAKNKEAASPKRLHNTAQRCTFTGRMSKAPIEHTKTRAVVRC